MPEIRNETASAATLAPVKVLERKKRRGIIGRAVRDSTKTNATSSTTAAAKAVRMRLSVQPRSPASISPQTSDASAAVTSTVPGMSAATVPLSSRDSRTTAVVTRNAPIPIGTLIRNTQFQLAYCTSSPPTIGPSASPETEIADQIPSAFPRSSGGNASEIRDSESGMMNAPPNP